MVATSTSVTPTVPALNLTPTGKLPHAVAASDTYQYAGRDRTAEAAITAAARDGVRRCGCKHCCKARAERPLVGAAK